MQLLHGNCSDGGKIIMNKTEAAVIMAYTGVCLLVGEDMTIFQRYVCGLLGHPIWSHEYPAYADKIKELSEKDFREIMENLKE